MTDIPEGFAKVTITTPKGDQQQSLRYLALDSHARSLAKQTWVTVDGKILPSMSYAVKENGNLMLEIQPPFFEIVKPEGKEND